MINIHAFKASRRKDGTHKSISLQQRSAALHNIKSDVDAAALQRGQNVRQVTLGAVDIEARGDNGDTWALRHVAFADQMLISGQHAAPMHEIDNAVGEVVGALSACIEDQFGIFRRLIG